MTEEEKQAEPEVRLMEQNAQPVTLSGECGATEDDEVTWELAKNGETLYRKANENGFDYSTSAKDGYEAVDSYTLTISGEGNMKDYYAKGITLDSFAEDITPWRRALLSDVSADRTTQEVVHITQVVVSSGITGLFPIVNGFNHFLLGNMFRQRELYNETIHVSILIQFSDLCQ